MFGVGDVVDVVEMREETKAAIQAVVDLWDFRKVTAVSVIDTPGCTRAFMKLREGLREETYCVHEHTLDCWVDASGEDRPYRSCGELDWLEQKQKIKDLEMEIAKIKELMSL